MCPERFLMGGVPRPNHCPGDHEGVAKAYAMDNLPRADAAAFEEHLSVCAACRRAVEDAGRFGKAMHEAALRLRAASGRG